MKKRNIKNKIDGLKNQNPVAKFAYRFNKTQVFCDKRKYSRKTKHNGQEVFPVVFSTELPEKSPVLIKPEIALAIY
jgi:hypothetical protein